MQNGQILDLISLATVTRWGRAACSSLRHAQLPVHFPGMLTKTLVSNNIQKGAKSVQSSPESYPIADFIKWERDGQLKLDPDFQRGEVWPRHVQVFLIDSILRGMPIPKILFRTTIDRETQQVVRDVVDGQQRLRAILTFAKNELRLSPRSAEFSGFTYTDLPHDIQDKFLTMT